MTAVPRFALLALSLAAACAAPRSQALELRIERSAALTTRRVGDYLVVDVSIDGRPAVPLLVDTGAYHSSIDPELAAELGAAEVCRAIVVGWGGEVESSIVRAKTLDAGPLHVDGPVFTVVRRFEDSAPKSERQLAGIRGIFGNEMFDAFVLSIDYRTPAVKLQMSTSYDASERQPLHLRSDGDGRYLASITLGEEPVWLLLDTGANDTVTVSPDIARSLELDPDRGLVLRGFALGGSVNSRQVGSASVKIGDRSVRMPLYTSEQLAGLDGRVGSGLLRNWKWIFDFQNQLMWAE